MKEVKKISLYKIINTINERYDLFNYEISSYEEVWDFYNSMISPLVRLSPNFFDSTDGDIVSMVVDIWGEEKTQETIVTLKELLDKSSTDYGV